MDTREKTYRYIRVGLVMAVLLVGVSVAAEAVPEACLKGSISAYYHTPVRPIFVGGLMIISFGLITLRGNPDIEDILLNFAGILAPIVALVPAVEDGLCTGQELATQTGLSDAEVEAVSDNLRALFLVGGVSLCIAIVLGALSILRTFNSGDPDSKGLSWYMTQMRRPLKNATEFGTDQVAPASTIGTLLTAVAFAVVVYVFLSNRSSFLTKAHATSAILMFGFLALACVVNSISWKDEPERDIKLRVIYGIIGVLMILALPATWLLWGESQRFTLILEIIEISLFAVYWSIQTVENWREDKKIVKQRSPHALR